jgi:ADP-ribose pyrophosphatase YjhB (NUDIX family)
LLVKHTYVRGWHLPGGGIGKGESAQQSLLREIIEETGFLIFGSPKLIGIFHNKTRSKRDHVVLFLSENFSLRDRSIDAFEIKEVKFFPIDSLPTDIDKSSKEWLLAALNFKQ